MMSSLLLGIALTGTAPTTQVVTLDHGWQYQVVRPDTDALPTTGWLKSDQPYHEHLPNPGTTAGIWHQRIIQTDGSANSHFEVVVTVALYAPELWIDNTKVSAWKDGWSNKRTDITPYVRDGKPHLLSIHTHDRSVTQDDGSPFFEAKGEGSLRGKVVLPVGGYKNLTGILRQVYLVKQPAKFISASSLDIRTSVRNKQISVTGMAENSASGDQINLSLISESGTKALSANSKVSSDGSFSITAPWQNLKLWSPASPNLYKLQLELMSGNKLVHTNSQSIGIREIWIKGQDFYLNGVKTHFRGTGSWPISSLLSKSEVFERLKRIKDTGLNAVRFHIGPWQTEFYDACDQLGLLAIDETPLYTDGSGFYAYKNPAFWQNYKDVVRGMIERGRNHPSMVMWSLGNEILFMGNKKYDNDLPRKLGDIARFAKSIDPTRPVTFEADLDPDHAADVVGLHYPHELPYQHAYPAICDWVDEVKITEAGGGMLGQARNSFKWDRKKPLYIGEYLWVPFGDFAPGSVFFGDEAYANRELINDRAKARAWIDQTIAYRRAGVSGLAPWTSFGFGLDSLTPIIGPAQVYAHQPVAAYARNFPKRYYEGDNVELTVDVFNDSETPKKLRLTLAGSDNNISKEVSIAAGEQAKVLFESKALLGEKDFVLTLSEGAKVISSKALRYTGYKQLAIKAPSGFELVQVSKPGQLELMPNPSRTVAIVEEGKLPDVSSDVKGFAEKGGRVVVLAQTSLKDFGLELFEHGSTMGFSSSELFQENPEMLELWGPGMYIATNQFKRTGTGGLRSLSVTGGGDALAQSPLAFRAYGQGYIAFSQLRTGSVDPAGKLVLQKTIDFLCKQVTPKTGSVLVVGATGEYKSMLTRIGLQAEYVDGKPSSDQISRASGVVLYGGTAPVFETAQAIRHRKDIPVFWDTPTAPSLATVWNELELPSTSKISLEPYTGTAILFNRQDWLLNGVTREETTLTTPPTGWDHSIQFKTSTVPYRLVIASADSSLVNQIRASQMALTKGTIVNGRAEVIQRGDAAFDVTVPKAGEYSLRLDIRGVPDGKTFPHMNVLVNDFSCGYFSVNDSAINVPVRLRAGSNRVALSLINGSKWGSVPILSIGSASVITLPATDEAQELIGPNALTKWIRGNSVVLINTFNVINDKENQRKADLYYGAMFGNLNLPFRRN